MPAVLEYTEGKPTVEDAVDQRFYEPHGAAEELFCSSDRELLIDGPAGTGKSRSILEKIHAICNDAGERGYRDLRVLIARKERKSMSESILVIFEQDVMVDGERDFFGRGSRRYREIYSYPTGSTVVVGGLDNANKIMSSQYDIIAVFEATEATLEDWEMLMTRLRNNKLDYQQGIADCNPSSPSHWLNQRALEGKMRRLISRHTDNPMLYNHIADDWTDVGSEYLARLDMQTGVRRQRLLLGQWVAAEGVVFEDWDTAVHIIEDDKDLNGRFKNVIASKDWGFRNPGVTQVWGLDGDKNMYCIAQIYRHEELDDWWIEKDKQLAKEFKIDAFICDPSEPGHIERYLNAGLTAIGADNDISVGLRLVAERLQKKSLYFVRGNLRYTDKRLAEAHHPYRTEDEFESYVWEQPKDGRNDKEKPRDQYNHGCDAMRYACMYAETMSMGGMEAFTAGINVPEIPKRRING